MSKAKIYTKAGDQGETSLVGGSRVLKSNPQVELYGTVDELNSYLGLVICKIKNLEIDQAQVAVLKNIQNRLFDLGSFLACEKNLREAYNINSVSNSAINELEENIDSMDSTLSPLKNFILPGGSEVSSWCHISRTICRKVERRLVNFDQTDEIHITYVNRLSDYLFTLSRYLNKQMGIQDELRVQS